MKSTLKYIILIIFVFGSVIGYSQSEKPDSNAYLIVLDVQEGYSDIFDPELYPQFIESVNSAIENTEPDHVIYVSSLHKALVLSFKGISIDTLIDAVLDSNLTVVNSTNYIKNEGNAFTVDSLVDFLNINNTTDIIVIGLAAERCVYNTLIGGRELGYNMFVIPEAIIAKKTNKKLKAISKLSKKGVKVLSLKDYCS